VRGEKRPFVALSSSKGEGSRSEKEGKGAWFSSCTAKENGKGEPVSFFLAREWKKGFPGFSRRKGKQRKKPRRAQWLTVVEEKGGEERKTTVFLFREKERKREGIRNAPPSDGRKAKKDMRGSKGRKKERKRGDAFIEAVARERNILSAEEGDKLAYANVLSKMRGREKNRSPL